MLHLQPSLKMSFKHAARASVTGTLIFTAAPGDDHASPRHPSWEGRPKNLWIALRVASTPKKTVSFADFLFFFNQNLSWLKHTCAHPWDGNIQVVSLPPASVKNLLRSCQTMTSLRVLETGNAALNIHRVTFIHFVFYFLTAKTFVTPLFIVTGCWQNKLMNLWGFLLAYFSCRFTFILLQI